MTKETKKLLTDIISDFKKATELPCYSVKLLKRPPNPDMFENKIGGMPYLPVNEKYPCDKKGNPMALLLQINCKDIDLPAFPKTGYFEIYMNASLDIDSECIVKHFEDGQTCQFKFPAIDMSDFIIERPYAIKLQKTTCYMPASDYRFDKTFLEISTKHNCPIECIYEISKVFPNEENIETEFISLLSKAIKNPEITIGGYADFTQDDPRFYDDEKDFCILKIDSYYPGSLINIGDAGILNVYTHLNEFQSKNFASTELVWDCY